MRDPYEVLGVARRASFDEIKAAFRRLSTQRHPDMPGGSLEDMRELLAAYEQVLNDLKQAYAAKNSTQDGK
jgi:DnaJ-class molecular chaperone